MYIIHDCKSSGKIEVEPLGKTFSLNYKMNYDRFTGYPKRLESQAEVKLYFLNNVNICVARPGKFASQINCKLCDA